MHVLVAYASKLGGTEEIARVIAEELRRVGHEVDVRAVRDEPEVGGYDAVLLGSAVYYGKWRPEALEFGHRHATSLKGRPVWLFDSGPLNESPDTGKNEPVAAADALVTELGAKGRTTFGGRLRREDVGFVMHRVMASGKAGTYGDHRNLARVRAWASAIGQSLVRTEPIAAA